MKNYKKILASLLAISMVASFASFSVSAAVGDVELGRGEVLFEENFDNMASIDDLSSVGMETGYSNKAGTYQVYTDFHATYTNGTKVLEAKSGAKKGAYAYASLPISEIDETGDGVYLVECDMWSGVGGGLGIILEEPQNTSGTPDIFYAINGAATGRLFINGTDQGDVTNGNYATSTQWNKISIIYNAKDGKFYIFWNGGYHRGYELDVVNKNVGAFVFGNRSNTTSGARAVFDNIKITKLDTTTMNVFGFSVAPTDSNKQSLSAKYLTLDAAKADEDDVVYATLNGYNFTGKDASSDYIAAAYDVNDKLVAVTSGTASFGLGSPVGSYSFQLGSALLGNTVSYIKFFAWDGLTTMVPMAEAVIFN